VPDFPSIWRVPDADVGDYAGAVRVRGRVELHAGGSIAQDERFRLASVSKPMGGALALGLVQDGVLALDDPIERWLPEAADPRVLVRPDAPLDRTVPAARPVTVRMLLSLTSGWGAVFAPTPLQAAMRERGVHPPGPGPEMASEDFVAGLCSLPLAFQPGEGWLYDTGLTLLGVLLERAAGRPLPELFAERISEPLGMAATAFEAGAAFARLNAGLVSTAADVLRFFTAMADGGAPVLLTTAALTAAQRRDALAVVGPGASWTLGAGVDVEPVEPWMAPGRWGWNGGSGTSAWVDPLRDTVAVLLTRREMTGPLDRPTGFWTAVAEAAGE
jgi:CubicO group peptidase (beta-lactamase class C family)